MGNGNGGGGGEGEDRHILSWSNSTHITKGLPIALSTDFKAKKCLATPQLHCNFFFAKQLHCNYTLEVVRNWVWNTKTMLAWW